MVRINASQLASFDYQVFGLVQGVNFRYTTYKFANKLNLVGFVQNTYQRTVIGSAQGKFGDLACLAYFLEKQGSPHSRIEKLELTNCRLIDKLDYDEFFVKKTDTSIGQNVEQDPERSKEIEAELKELGKLKYESQG